MRPAPIGKATCLITRLGRGGPEVCVFEHPTAGIQLPAGTLEPGEDPLAGARREAFEETGLAPLEAAVTLGVIPASRPGHAIVARPCTLGGDEVPVGYNVRVLGSVDATGEVEVVVGGRRGSVPAEALATDALRHLVHLPYDGPAPAEWWVLSPDGGGNAWRCHWLPIDTAGVLGAWHQEWLDAVRPQLVAAAHPPARPPVHGVDGVELRWAPPWPPSGAVVRWLDPGALVADAVVDRVEAVPVTVGAGLVAVSEYGPALWTFPGGRVRPGERPLDALARVLVEAASVRLVDAEVLGFAEVHHLGDGLVVRVETEARYWARVELDPSVPDSARSGRRLVPVAAASAVPLWQDPVMRRFVGAAIAVDVRRTATGPSGQAVIL